MINRKEVFNMNESKYLSVRIFSCKKTLVGELTSCREVWFSWRLLRTGEYCTFWNCGVFVL